MQIHNFLTDLLSSVRLLIDNHLFPHNPGFVKSYEFNLGNRTFQLGLEPTSSYALPAVIINLQDESINFGGRRSDLIQQNGLDSINKIPVLHNSTEDITAYVHEEQSIVPFSISFNCESQLQAKEIAYQIKRILPLYKNLNILEFTTFLEIDNNILFEYLKYDILLNEIDNLYTKLNHNTGNIEYCFSLAYKPLVRLDSVTTSISDSSQSTFQTQLELSYVIPFPQFLIINKDYYVENINILFSMPNQGIVVPTRNIAKKEVLDQKIDRTLIVDTELTGLPSGVNISTTDTQASVAIQFHENDFLIDNEKYSYRFTKVTADPYSASQDLVPEYYFAEDNKIVFILSLADYESIKPTTFSPLLIDFYYDL
jgi:hypothetical protein